MFVVAVMRQSESGDSGFYDSFFETVFKTYIGISKMALLSSVVTLGGKH